MSGSRGTVPLRKKLDSLQVLRGLSALSVVFYHVHSLTTDVLGADPSFLSMWNFGLTGVDFFFVLSGFIMYYIHERDFGIPSRLKPFVLKRAIRIYPVYWILTLAVILAFYLVPGSIKAYKFGGIALARSFLLLPPRGLPIIPPAWSLTHEIRFYCLFALAICFPRRFSLWFFGVVGILSFGLLLTLMVPAWNVIDPIVQRNYFYFMVGFIFHPLNLEFAAGVACAYLLKRYAIRNGNVISGIGLFLVLLVATIENESPFAAIWRILWFGIPYAILLLGAAAWNYQSPTLVFRSFVFLGEASYSLYLIHYPLCSAASRVFLKLGLVRVIGFSGSAFLMVFLALSVSTLFHWLVERPLLDTAHRHLLNKNKQS